MSKIWARVSRNEFDPAIQGRGRIYFQSHRVSLESLDANRARFKVLGTHPYQVELLRSLQDTKLQWSCNCPHFSSRTPCKHIWAAILFSDEKELFERPALGGGKGEAPSLPGWRSGLLQAEQRLRAQTKLEEVAGPRGAEAPLHGAYALDLKQSQDHKKLYLQILTEDRPSAGGPSLGYRLTELSPASLAQFPEDADQEILEELLGKTEIYGAFDSLNKEKRASTVVLRGEHAAQVLRKISDKNKLFKLNPKNPPVGKSARVEVDAYAFRDEFWGFHLDLRIIDQNYYLIPSLRSKTESKRLRDCELAMTDFVFFETFMARSDFAKHPLWVEFFARNREVEILPDEVNDFLEYFFQQSSMPVLHLPEELKFTEAAVVPPQVCLSMTPLKPAHLGVRVEFLYGNKRVSSGNANEFVYDIKARNKFPRNLAYEDEVRREILAQGASAPSRAAEEAFDFVLRESQFVKTAESFLAKNWEVLVAEKAVKLGRVDQVEIQATGVDWFDLKVHLRFGQRNFSLPELLAQLQAGVRTIPLGDGTTGILPEEWFRRFGPILEMGQLQGEELRLNKVQALFLSSQLEGYEHFHSDKRFGTLRNLLFDLQNLTEKEAGKKFSGELRPYQKKGLAWLDLISGQGIGGILADDMGLGKTIQIIALLVAQKSAAGAKGKSPTLIVAPRSLIFNWLKELEKFAPHLKTLDYTGKRRTEVVKDLKKFDVVLTTYQTLRMDVGILQEKVFDFFVIDEAHYIKNSEAQSSQACRLIQARQKLALTGTPVENSLLDLFSILEVVNPGLISRDIRERYSRERDLAALKDLGRALRPFILRRTKEEVLKDLPAKSEQILYCELSATERKKYDEMKQHYWTQLSQVIEQKSLARSKIEVLEALLRLRQAACHQGLLNAGKRAESSSKFDLLLDQLSVVIQDGHKALIFSQFTSLLGLLKTQLEARGIRYEYLDGQTKDRQERVERFQGDPEIPVFLLSLKAGGVGLNLTSADYVFILDPWWNPAAESQAIDRAHRIGQTQKVFAYKIIAKDTVEEKILELQKSKKAMAKAIIGTSEEGVLKGLKLEDLKALFG